MASYEEQISGTKIFFKKWESVKVSFTVEVLQGEKLKLGNYEGMLNLQFQYESSSPIKGIIRNVTTMSYSRPILGDLS